MTDTTLKVTEFYALRLLARHGRGKPGKFTYEYHAGLIVKQEAALALIRRGYAVRVLTGDIVVTPQGKDAI